MEKKQKIAMFYGYAICMACVITFIISLNDLVAGVIDIRNPSHSAYSWNYSANLVSFDLYKMSVLNASENETTFTLDEKTLQAMYISAKDDMLQSHLHNSRRQVIVNGLLIVLCAAFFVIHWIWMQKLIKK